MNRMSRTALTLVATLMGCANLVAGNQPAPPEDRAGRLEEAREAIEARLTRSTLREVAVTASDSKRVRQVSISVAPMNKDPRDDASTALSLAWQPALRFVTAFDEIAVRIGSTYTVTCGSRAFADPTVSLWGEGLARTCRERRRRGSPPPPAAR